MNTEITNNAAIEYVKWTAEGDVTYVGALTGESQERIRILTAVGEMEIDKTDGVIEYVSREEFETIKYPVAVLTTKKESTGEPRGSRTQQAKAIIGTGQIAGWDKARILEEMQAQMEITKSNASVYYSKLF